VTKRPTRQRRGSEAADIELTKPVELASHVEESTGMVVWKPVELPDALLNQLLDCLRVPHNRRESAALCLPGILYLALECYDFDKAEDKRDVARKELARLAGKAAAFRSELDKLSNTARVWLGAQAWRRETFGEAANDAARRFQLNDLMLMGGVEEGRTRYERFCATIESIRAASAEEFWPTGSKGGAPSKAVDGPKSNALDLLVCELYRLADKAGWYVSVDPDMGTGTLVDFLKTAAPHLPQGLIPDGLPLKRLQRHGTEVRRHSQVRQTKGAKQRPPPTGQKPRSK
jgi:hypothetical protein